MKGISSKTLAHLIFGTLFMDLQPENIVSVCATNTLILYHGHTGHNVNIVNFGIVSFCFAVDLSSFGYLFLYFIFYYPHRQKVCQLELV